MGPAPKLAGAEAVKAPPRGFPAVLEPVADGS